MCLIPNREQLVLNTLSLYTCLCLDSRAHRVGQGHNVKQVYSAMQSIHCFIARAADMDLPPPAVAALVVPLSALQDYVTDNEL